jgi:mannosyltransferase
MPSITIQALALAGILTLAAILRFVGLGAESLWQDEILSVLGYQRPWLDIVTERLTYNQPFYFLMLRFWAQLFGESEFSLRFPSAVFGVATVLAAFVLARHLSNVWIALGAALLVAVSPVLIWHSQEVRFYALTAFLLVGSTYFLIRYLETRRTWLVVAYAVIAFLGAYTHYYFLPLVAAHNLVALVWLLRDRRHLDLVKWLAAQLIVSLALIVRMSTVWADVSQAAGGGYTVPLSRFLLRFAEYLGLADRDLGGLLPLFIAAWALIVISSVVALWRRDKIAVLVVVCLVPLIQLTLGAIFFDLPIVMRHLVPTIPLWNIIICYGFAWLASQLSPAGPVAMRAFVTAGVALLLGWTLTSWGQQLVIPTRQQWRETAEFLENNALPSELLVVVPPRHFKHLSYYLDNPGWEPGSDPVCQDHRRIWLVGTHPRVSEARRKLQKACSAATITTRFVVLSAAVLLPSNSNAASVKDSRILRDGLSPTILGFSGDERIDGTPGDDIIHGMSGNDRIVTKSGNDVVCGGERDDTLLGQDGGDTLVGNNGDDTLYSGPGNDKLNGGPGTDQCAGRGSNREQDCEPVK